MKDMATFIEGMPKADLHVHIEGALEPEMKFEMAARNGFSLPYKTVDEVVASYDFHDLVSFLDARYEGDGVLITEHDFYERLRQGAWDFTRSSFSRIAFEERFVRFLSEAST